MDLINSLLRAARTGNLKRVVEFIEDELIDINASNQNGLTALHSASKEGHVKVVQELISRGANVHAKTLKGNTALHIASLAGYEPIVKLLIEHGADVDAQSVSGFTALYMAAQENHESIVRLLLSSGANQNIATIDGFTGLNLKAFHEFADWLVDDSRWPSRNCTRCVYLATKSVHTIECKSSKCTTSTIRPKCDADYLVGMSILDTSSYRKSF